MSRFMVLTAAWALALAQIASAQPGNGSTTAAWQEGIPAGSDVEFAPGEILLAFRPGVAADQVDAVQLAVAATQIRQFPQIGVRHWRLPPGLTVDRAVTFLSAIPFVEYAEPNYILRGHVFPNDLYMTYPFSQWPLHNWGWGEMTLDADIDATEAWDVQTGSADVVVAVIDSGIDFTHEDLAGNIWVNPGEVLNGIDDDGNGYVDDVQGWDFRNNDNDPSDDRGHGTHVAGIIGAVGNNGIGVAGVNWTVTLMPLKFLDSAGDGWTDDAIEAIQYAADFGVRITNNSWSGGKSHALEVAIENAGALFVASAGNDGSSQKEYPAASTLDNIISVAATDGNDELASFSNYGESWVDLGAPGVWVLSTVPTGDCPLSNPNGYLRLDGTSMAAPHVAGVAALLMAEDPEMDILTIRDRILAGVDPLPSLEGKTVTGGRLNAFAALPRPPGIVVEPVEGLVTIEAGTSVVFSVALYGEPAADVSIDLASGDLSEGTVSPSSLIFTLADWDLPQQVIVTGVDDAVADGHVTYTVLTAPSVSTDPEYDGLDADDVLVTNLDDDGFRAQDGSIVAWGNNSLGQCDVPLPNSDFVAVAAGHAHTVGLKSDGSIVAWGQNDSGQCDVPLPNSDFVAIGAGMYHSLAVKSDGSIVAWGNNNLGGCDVPPPNTDFVDVAGGGGHTLGLKSDGSIVAWGYNDRGQCDVPLPNTDFVAVAASYSHSLGLKSDGSVVAWGDPSTTPTPNTDFVAVTAGWYHSLGLKIDGSIVEWNRHGQSDAPAPNTDFVAVAAGCDHSLGVKAYGSIVPWGGNGSGQLIVPAPNTGFVAVAAGHSHSLGLVGLPPDPGITVTPTLGLVTTEAGGFDTFSVVLDSQPAADVTIDLSSSDLSEGTVSPAYLVFSAADWDLPQEVFVTGVDDAIVDGDIPYTIVTAPAFSADPDYDWLDADDVSVTNLDDDAVGVTVSTIWPDWMNAGTTIDVTITGSGFADGASVMFETGAGVAPTADVTFVSADGSMIEATVTAHKNAKTAVWDVRVTNPDYSTGVLIDGFTVVK